jgi:DNA replicative helicase MCM subunit Mcm2 (Cdc46/Mcm family)
MEQQTVTIAKAGIHAALNARCSVIAAANPIYGQYDKSRRPQENIGLPDSLLSRFDLLFIVLDQLDPALDRRLSEHVLRSHQFRRPGTIMEPEPLNMQSTVNLDDAQNIAMDTPVWLRNGNSYTDVSAQRGDNDVLNKDFLRKFIHYAKQRIHPVLSEDAMDRISEAYAAMRAQQTRKNLPITARTLETIIRLASAAAKCRLSQSVDIDDVETAMGLINFVLFHEIGTIAANTTISAPSSSSANTPSDLDLDNTSTEGDDHGIDIHQSPLYAEMRTIIVNASSFDSFEMDDLVKLLKGRLGSTVNAEQLKAVLNIFEAEDKVNHSNIKVFCILLVIICLFC